MKQPIKRDFDQLNLRGAFRDEPEKCHQALMTAVRSVKEEEKESMKHLNFRPLLIAAIIIVSMVSVAFAASEIFGLNDYFRSWGITPTQNMQAAMKPEAETTFTVGPITFTAQERIADPYTAMVSTRFATADGTRALIRMFPEDMLVSEKYVDNFGGSVAAAELADRLGFYEYSSVTWNEAAQQLGLPLYQVRVRLTPAPEQKDGSFREDIMWEGDGSSGVFISYGRLRDVEPNSEIAVTLDVYVSQINPDTGVKRFTWHEQIDYRIPVSQLIAEGRYVPETPLVTDDATLTDMRAELYETGPYIWRNYRMPEDMPYDPRYPMWEVANKTPLLTADGTPFTGGVSLGRQYDLQDWPTVTLSEMVNVTELPQVIQVGGVRYVLQPE